MGRPRPHRPGPARDLSDQSCPREAPVPLYVTITPTASGSLVAHGPCAEPVAVAEPAVCLVLCPRSAVSRATWNLNHPYEYAAAPRDLAALPEQRPIAVTVAELNAPTVAVVLHPLTPKMLVVGPFTGPDRAEQWWHVSVNRYANGDALCHILPLTTPDAESDEDAGDLR